MTSGSTPLTHFSLFSGIGGLDLAAEWAGFRTIGQVEKGRFANRILAKHWPNVQRWKDIKDVDVDDVIGKTGIESPTLITGGFPCQPFSSIGQRRSKDDPRYLWPEMLRVVREWRPTWIVGENVAGITGLALDQICSDLEDIGYACRPFNIPAGAVGADQLRRRVFVVANDVSPRSGKTPPENVPVRTQQSPRGNVRRSDGGIIVAGRRIVPLSKWAGVPKPTVTRNGDGVPYRVDRCVALGNAVVPQQVYPILKGIADIEQMVED
jgi:DNA (cytosine-5)-methyltransferase 1